MKGFRTTGLGLVVVATLLGACGSSKGGKGRGPDARDEQSQDGLALDMAQLAMTDSSARDAVAGDTSWWMRVTVNGSERADLANASISEVSAAVKDMRFSRRDTLRLEVTIAKASDPASVLATNVEEVAHRSSQTAAIWTEQCASEVDPEVDLSGVEIPASGAPAKIELRLCDFVGFSLKPLVEIKPQSKILDKKTVIYQCAVKVSTTTNSIYTYTDTPCPYGYATEPNEAAPTISILKKYAPGEPLYTTNILVLDDFTLDLSNAGTTQLKTDFYKPPFGSHEACHTQKVDVKYGTPDGIRTARLTFKREGQADGSVIWMPQNSASWPSMAEIKSYYAQAGADERVRLYRICDWIPEAEEVASGSVIQFSVQ